MNEMSPEAPESLFPELPAPSRPEAMSRAESVAAQFHARYERLAPEHGYETRKASAVPWEQVPENNRSLMTAVVLSLLDDGVITVPDDDLPYPLPCCGTRVHYSHNAGCSEANPPAPAGRLARVEVKGFRDLGIVRVTESTLAGEPMLRAEAKDGAVAEFPASSLHFITWLPEGAEMATATPRPSLPGWMDEPDDGDDLDDDDCDCPGGALHREDCPRYGSPF